MPCRQDVDIYIDIYKDILLIKCSLVQMNLVKAIFLRGTKFSTQLRECPNEGQ